jgi:hypothetical protein
MEAGNYSPAPARGVGRRLSTETKQAFKTSEFWIYVVLLLGVLIAGTVNDSEGSEFGADNVWLYATILTVGYLLSRGLAKSGSRDPYWDQPNTPTEDSLGERVKAAAQVLTDGPATGANGEETPTTSRPATRTDRQF